MALFASPFRFNYLLRRCSVSVFSVTTLYLFDFSFGLGLGLRLCVSQRTRVASVHNPASAKHLSLTAMPRNLCGVLGHDVPFDPRSTTCSFCYWNSTKTITLALMGLARLGIDRCMGLCRGALDAPDRRRPQPAWTVIHGNGCERLCLGDGRTWDDESEARRLCVVCYGFLHLCVLYCVTI